MSRPPTLAENVFHPHGEREENDRLWDAYWRTDEGKADAAELRRAEQARYDGLLQAAIVDVLRHGAGPHRIGLPARALDIVLAGGLIETPALQAVHGAQDIVILLGSPGTGKTVAGCERMREEIATPGNWQARSEYDGDGRRQRIPVYDWNRVPVWITAAALARLDHFSDAALKPIMTAPLLVLDDLGAEFYDSKGFFGSLFDELVDVRYGGKLPTVVTSNLNSKAFADRYGQRVVDRICEAGRFVGCGNTSMRGKAGT